MTTVKQQSRTALKRARRYPLPSLGLNTSERRLFLLVGDVVLVNVMLLIAVYLMTDLLPTLGSARQNYKWFVTLSVLWVSIAAVFDCYNLARSASTAASTRTIASAFLVTSLIYWLIPWLTPPIVNRSLVLGFVLFGVLALLIWRTLYATIFVQPSFMRRALIVGAGESGSMLAAAMQSDYALSDFNPFRGTGYHVVGFVDDRPDLIGTRIENIPVVANGDDLLTIVERHQVVEVIVAISRTDLIQPRLADGLMDCRERGLPIIVARDLYERLTGRVVLDPDALGFSLHASYHQTSLRRLYLMTRRLLDYVGAIAGSAILLLLVPPIWFANRLTSPGPLFYRQTRLGQGGQPFTIIKFRSMVPDAETNGALWAAKGDDRVTPVGRLLRATHLDELPQFINILRGEMSLIGPRPERPEFVKDLARDIPFYRARHAVRPGLTGWAQIHQNYGDSPEGAREKLGYDLYYIKHASPLLDASIALRTVAKMIGLHGR